MKVYVAEFIFSKIPDFQHTVLNTFGQMCINYKNTS